jgi:hypothetical protein
MHVRWNFICGLALGVLAATVADARVNVVVVRSDAVESKPSSTRQVAPPPSAKDAATRAKVVIVDGTRDPNGGDVGKLVDGGVPTQADQPSESFFFAEGTPGGRLVIDLENLITIDQVNTYSRHPSTRGPQVYKLYASDGLDNEFEHAPKRGTDPKKVGWVAIGDVDTRRMESDPGGKYGVSIFDSDGPIGKFRYLLLDISRTENDDPFGNTFYSEIDVVASTAPAEASPSRVTTFKVPGGQRFTIDTTGSPKLTEWAEKELAPVVQEWYPKISKLLLSDNFSPPDSFSITFSPAIRGVAATGGTQIRCGENWFLHNLQGEAKGAVVHELVHVVQQYKWTRRNESNGPQTPGWLVEGIADYIRWFIYEPQSHGADIRPQSLAAVRFDDSYRVSANFLNWITEKYGDELVAKLNAALREGRYRNSMWTELTGKPVETLGAEWKANLGGSLVAAVAELSPAAPASKPLSSEQPINILSDKEKSEGWQLLFDGKDFVGWHNFGAEGVRPGWKIKEGTLACVDPHNAGDLCTADQFEWFELKLQYNISKGGNSGIMFRVSEKGNAPWESGPEFQLEDNAFARDPIRCGWLYALYQPPNDSGTAKPLDATKPAGEWNEVRLLVSPDKCVHEINGVKYFEYVLGSQDFRDRVAKSKFGTMPMFGKSPRGFIALQGDHGEIAFRNIKLRKIEKP